MSIAKIVSKAFNKKNIKEIYLNEIIDILKNEFKNSLFKSSKRKKKANEKMVFNKILNHYSSKEDIKSLLIENELIRDFLLGIAFYTKNNDKIDEILELNNNNIKYVLYYCIMFKYLNYLKLMLSQTDSHDDIYYALGECIKQDNYKCIKIILETGIDVNSEKYCDGLMKITLAHQAILDNSGSCLKTLIEYKIDINKSLYDTKTGKKRCTPFFASIEENNIHCTEILLKSKVDIDKDMIFGQLIRKNNFVIIDLLLKYGIDINEYSDSGSTLLTIASSINRPQVIKKLIERKADIDRCAECGCPPVYTAATRNKYNNTVMLIQCKANLEIKMERYFTVLGGCICEGNSKMADLLIRNKANLDDVFADEKGTLTALECAIQGDNKNNIIEKCLAKYYDEEELLAQTDSEIPIVD
jgi:ankyrin repeat protein